MARKTSSRPTCWAPSRLLRRAQTYWESLPAAEGRPSASCTCRPTRCTARWPDRPGLHRTAPYEPNSPYSASKAASDHFVRAWHHTYGMPVITTNCSNNYGPRQFPEKLIPLMIVNALAGKPLPVYGDGRRCATGCTSATTAARSARCWPRAAWARPTTSAAGTSAQHRGRADHLRAAGRVAAAADGKPYIDQVTYVKDRPGHDRRYAIDAPRSTRAGLEAGRNGSRGHPQDGAVVPGQRRVGGVGDRAAPTANGWSSSTRRSSTA
jgi:dTDP-glucose 4,6-dehydratase